MSNVQFMPHQRESLNKTEQFNRCAYYLKEVLCRMWTKCDECGVSVKMPPSRYYRSDNHFCSRQCHMIFMNRLLNPIRMTPEVREKLRMSRLGSGESKTYEKTYGRHTHRVVAEQKIGRPLMAGEIVHHIDGNKRNNDPSNLMVMTQAEHCRLHFKKER